MKLNNETVKKIKYVVVRDKDIEPEIAVAITLLCNDLLEARGKGNES